MAGTLDQSQGNSNTAYPLYPGGTYAYIGQGVTVGLAGEVLQVDLYIVKIGTPTGNFYVEIWSRDGAGKPSAKVSDSSSYNIADLSTTLSWVSFPIVNSGSFAVSDNFCIVVHYPAGSALNRLNVGIQQSNDYAGGILTFSYDPGAGWATTGYDLAFKTYMTSPASARRDLLLLGVG